MTSLADHLRERIRAEGPISVEAYMAACNAHYYATRDPLGAAGDFRLFAQGRQLAADLGGQVSQPRKVGLHRLQLADCLFLAPPVFEDAGSFFDEAPAVLRSRVQHAVQLALADDDVHLPAKSRIGQQLLDVQQAARRTVDGVLGAAGAEQGARNGDFAVFDGKRVVGVVDGERHVCPAQGRPAGRAGEDDVFHFAATQGLGPLFAHDPRQGVNDVGLAGAVGPHHRGDSQLEVERRGRRKRLEPADGQTLQMQGGWFSWMAPVALSH